MIEKQYIKEGGVTAVYKVYPDKSGRKPKVAYYILKYAGDEPPERYWVQGRGDDAKALVRAAVRERLCGASLGGGETAAAEPAGGVAPEALPRREERHASAAASSHMATPCETQEAGSHERDEMELGRDSKGRFLRYPFWRGLHFRLANGRSPRT